MQYKRGVSSTLQITNTVSFRVVHPYFTCDQNPEGQGNDDLIKLRAVITCRNAKTAVIDVTVSHDLSPDPTVRPILVTDTPEAL